MTETAAKTPEDALLRRNFGLGIANGTLVDASDQIASANMVVPWLLHAMGAFPFISSAAVPLVRAGQLTASLALGPAVVRARRGIIFRHARADAPITNRTWYQVLSNTIRLRTRANAKSPA